MTCSYETKIYPGLMRRNKYGAIKTKVDGIVFHSKKEAERYIDLKYQLKKGLISNLHLQHPFVLTVNGQKVCKYVSDFFYKRGEQLVVEDVKGALTAVFNLKWKLLGILYPQLTLEIYPPKKPRKRTTSSRRPPLSKWIREQRLQLKLDR